MPRAHYHPPRKPFACSCGERNPRHFDVPYKSICRNCRSDREAARLREKYAQREHQYGRN